MRSCALLWASLCLVLAVQSRAAEIANPDQGQQTVPKKTFAFADVNRRAQELSAQPFQRDQPDLPPPLNDLNYEQYSEIHFRADKSIWRQDSLPFELQMFHRGFVFKDRVRINIIDDGEPTPVQFDPGMFDYGKNNVPEQIQGDIGFAGFKVLYPLNRDDRFDEFAVFLGASYFRAIGQDQNYGLSARGLAIDTGLQTQEEFPVFREFWIEKPARDATSLTVYALLDSKRVTGAYKFVIKPGMHTVMEVKCRLFARDKMTKVGIAPLTSMFFHGENTDRFIDDYRPEVHDSDGLMIETGNGERIWRPLRNPRTLRLSDVPVDNMHGFGLFQRDRNFDHYQDLDDHYESRPSAWVEPVGKWGKGTVELVEIPTDAERYDNIVAYWIPATPIKGGDQLQYDYRLVFALDPEARLLGGKTVATRIGAGGTGKADPSHRRFVIDFAGQTLAGMDPTAKIDAMVSASAGTVSNVKTQYNPDTRGWRVFFELTPDATNHADLRCFLKSDHDVLSETWSYQWNGK